MVINWQDLMKYPTAIEQYRLRDSKYEDMFDIMQELIPIVYKGNRLDTFFIWIANCVEVGIINLSEKVNIRTYLIHGYGGF